MNSKPIKKKIRFKKGITTIHFPKLPEYGGELARLIHEFLSEYEIPKNSKIKVQREMFFHPKYGYDITEIIVTKW